MNSAPFAVALLAAPLLAQGYEPRLGPWLQAPEPGVMTVCWETEKECVGRVAFGPAPASLTTVVESAARRVHEVRLSGLAPATRYVYRVESDEGTSASFAFTSAPSPDARSVRIGVYGDTRTDPATHARCAALLLANRPALVVHTGDFVLYGPVTDQWRTMFFGPAKELLREIPIVTVLGNHEANHANYYRYFALPGADRRTGDKSAERWWSLRFGPLAILGLDPNAPGDAASEQGKWLAAEFAALPQAGWRVAAFHQPMFSAHPTREVNDCRAWWQEPFRTHGLDLVWAGHDHHYQRTWPIGSLLDGREPGPAIVHTTNGGGGAPLYPVTFQPWTRVTESTHGVAIWDFDGRQARVRQLRADGSLLEEFTVEKDARYPVAERVAAEVALWQDVMERTLRKKDPLPVRAGAAEASVEFEVPGSLPRAFRVTPRWESAPGWELEPLAPFVLQPGTPQALRPKGRFTWPACYPVPKLALEVRELDGSLPCRNHTVVLEVFRLWPLREIADQDGKADGFLTRDGRALSPRKVEVALARGSDGAFRVTATLDLGSEGAFGRGTAKTDDPDLLDVDEAFAVAFGVDQDRYLVAVNTKGTVYDAKNLDTKWQSAATVTTGRAGGRWTCELTVPAAALPGRVSRIDFVHHDAAGRATYEWVPTLGKSLDTRLFGTLVQR